MLHVFAHAMHFLYAMDHYQQYTTPIVAKVCIDTIQKKGKLQERIDVKQLYLKMKRLIR